MFYDQPTRRSLGLRLLVMGALAAMAGSFVASPVPQLSASQHPLVQFISPETTVGTGLLAPQGVAVDGTGNVFISDTGHHRVVEVPLSSTSALSSTSELTPAYLPQQTVPLTLSMPMYLLSSITGTLFISDGGLHDMVAYSPTTQQATFGVCGCVSPSGLAQGRDGSIIVADNATGHLLTIVSTMTPTILFSNTTAIDSIAMDSSNNVYFTDPVLNKVIEIDSAGQLKSTNLQFAKPSGLAVDAFDDLFISDQVAGTIIEIPHSGSSVVVASGLNNPHGLAFDALGNLFVADTGHDRVVEYHNVSAPPVATPYPVASSTAASANLDTPTPAATATALRAGVNQVTPVAPTSVPSLSPPAITPTPTTRRPAVVPTPIRLTKVVTTALSPHLVMLLPNGGLHAGQDIILTARLKPASAIVATVDLNRQVPVTGGRLSIVKSRIQLLDHVVVRLRAPHSGFIAIRFPMLFSIGAPARVTLTLTLRSGPVTYRATGSVILLPRQLAPLKLRR